MKNIAWSLKVTLLEWIARFKGGTGGKTGTKLEICLFFQVKSFQTVPSTLDHPRLHIPDLSEPSSNLRNL